MSIPSALSEEMIRRYATSKSWQRGEDYYHNGYVRKVVERGGLINAEVEGNHYQPYQVNMSFAGDELNVFYCSCPYDYGGICKHQVATLLVCLHEPHKIESRPTLEEILDRLDEVQTQALIQELVKRKPELINDIEHFADRIAPPVVVSVSKESETEKNITVDANKIRSQVRYILRDSVNHYEYGGEEDIATEEICSLIQDAQSYSQRGDIWNAIAMLTAITESCIENWDLVDDYGVEYHEVASELNEVWCETILSADIPEVDRVDLEVNLEFWHNEWVGYFDMAIAAFHQGWDYPPLKTILQGNIITLWDGEIPNYAKDLALIRLQILERQQRLTEYLYVADAEGLVTEYLAMLVSLDRVSEAMQYAESQVTTMEQALAFSKVLVNEQNAQSEALAIANKGLTLPGRCQYEMGAWTSEIALELDDLESAIYGKIIAFQANPNFSDYRKIEKLAEKDWFKLKETLLVALAKSNGWGIKEAKVDIYLYEGLVEKAIAVVNNVSYYESNLIRRVMDAAIVVDPDWVIKQACSRAESIMDAGKAQYYEEAIEWLKKARNAFIASERKREWSDYRTKLVEVHGRKRKLMGLMKLLA